MRCGPQPVNPSHAIIFKKVQEQKKRLFLLPEKIVRYPI